MLSLMVLAVCIMPAFAANAQINITNPKNGSTISPGNVTVTVNVKNFNLVNKLGQSNVAGQGHIHYYIDVAVPETPGKPATTAVGTFVPTPNTTWTWPNVMPGNHNFSVQLANNDHTPVIPLAYDTIIVTVKGAANATGQTGQNMAANATQNQTRAQNNVVVGTVASGASTSNMTNATVKITQPKNGSILSGGSVLVSASVDNIDLVQPGGKNVAGNGHLVFLMDTKTPTVAGQTVSFSNKSLMYVTNETNYNWTNVTPGNHSFSVVLVNNDNTTLNPAINDTIYITETGNLNISQVQAMQMNKTANMTMAPNRPVAAGNATGDPSPGKTATVNIGAKNIAFNMSTITVPAGSQVTVNFNNQDSGIQHNVAFYTDFSASKTIYKGPVITGSNKTTFTFTAPAQAGTYFFRCDIHPTQMTGKFVVQ